jgi:hypothetical protein
MMRHLSSGDYGSFFEELQNLSLEASPTIAMSLKTFRSRLAKHQLSTPAKSVLTNDKWVGAIISKMKSTDEEVLVQCLLTFLTLATMPGNFYRRSMVKRGAMKAAYSVLESMHEDEKSKKVACALLCYVKAHERKFQPNEATIRKLGEIVASKEVTAGREYALQTLYHAANQRVKQVVSDVVMEGKTLDAIVNIIGYNRTHENHFGCSLTSAVAIQRASKQTR